MAACSPVLAIRGKTGMDGVGFIPHMEVVHGPGQPVNDIPDHNIGPATGRVSLHCTRQ